MNIREIERQTANQRRAGTNDDETKREKVCSRESRRERERNKGTKSDRQGGKIKIRREIEQRHRSFAGRDVRHQTLMGQVGSSELKQNYRDRGVKGTIYVSG